MTVVIKLRNARFHKVVNIPEKKNCDRCNFKHWDLCSVSLKEINNMCNYRDDGYWDFSRVERSVIDD